jgi:uncharacterized protein (TIGR02266 family)
MDQKQRVHARFDVRLKARFQFEGKEQEGDSRNLSIGGMFIETTIPIPYGTNLKVSFQIPTHNQEITTNSTVCWIERDGTTVVGLGLKFGALRAIEVWALNQFFAQANTI